MLLIKIHKKSCILKIRLFERNCYTLKKFLPNRTCQWKKRKKLCKLFFFSFCIETCFKKTFFFFFHQIYPTNFSFLVLSPKLLIFSIKFVWRGYPWRFMYYSNGFAKPATTIQHLIPVPNPLKTKSALLMWKLLFESLVYVHSKGV